MKNFKNTIINTLPMNKSKFTDFSDISTQRPQKAHSSAYSKSLLILHAKMEFLIIAWTFLAACVNIYIVNCSPELWPFCFMNITYCIFNLVFVIGLFCWRERGISRLSGIYIKKFESKQIGYREETF